MGRLNNFQPQKKIYYTTKIDVNYGVNSVKGVILWNIPQQSKGI